MHIIVLHHPGLVEFVDEELWIMRVNYKIIHGISTAQL